MNMTYAEYYEAVSRRAASMYDITIAEVKRNYPDRFDLYWQAVRDMAENGEIIPARVLDSVAAEPECGRRWIHYLRHDHEKAMPEGYLTPAERRWHKEHPWG